MTWQKSTKRVVAPVAAAIPSRKVGTPGVILCYHGIGHSPAPEVVSLDEFRRQLDLLVHGFRVMSVTDLVDAIGKPDDGGSLRVSVTFDDGYKGVMEHALPLLLERGLHATAYVLPGLWGRTAAWPSEAPASERTLWEIGDAAGWDAAGMGLGSHGMHHIDLSVASVGEIDEELVGSKVALEGVVRPIEGFCYPWGRVSPVAQERVRAAGYRYALAGGYRRRHGPEELFALGRVTVDHDDTIEDLRMKLRGGYDWLDGVGRLRSKVGTWRSS